MALNSSATDQGANTNPMDSETQAHKARAEGLVKSFLFKRLLNQDQQGRRVALLGEVQHEAGILLIERAAFIADVNELTSIAQSLAYVRNLGANDIYSWFMAKSGDGDSRLTGTEQPDLKLNLIWPCTKKHIAKYSSQGMRTVVETPDIYRNYVRPFMQQQREKGSLQWVFNILEGRTEQEDVIMRQHSGEGEAKDEGFLLLPDLNWDRATIPSLHLLAVVERRDIWSLRDLTKEHVPWLQHMRQKILDATTQLYPALEEDQIKLYVHYQPTYYHFHVHVVHVMLEAGATQAVGKAFGLDNLIGQLEGMADGKGMADVQLSYGLGEASELWMTVFEKLKSERDHGKRKREIVDVGGHERLPETIN